MPANFFTPSIHPLWVFVYCSCSVCFLKASSVRLVMVFIVMSCFFVFVKLEKPIRVGLISILSILLTEDYVYCWTE